MYEKLGRNGSPILNANESAVLLLSLNRIETYFARNVSGSVVGGRITYGKIPVYARLLRYPVKRNVIIGTNGEAYRDTYMVAVDR